MVLVHILETLRFALFFHSPHSISSVEKLSIDSLRLNSMDRDSIFVNIEKRKGKDGLLTVLRLPPYCQDKSNES